MLISRQFKNNLGYQVDVERPHPIWKWDLERYNKNYYSYDGFNTKMVYHKGSQKGMQYGGQKGSGMDPVTIGATLKMLYEGAKAATDVYASQTATVIKNKWGKMMNNDPNWRPGLKCEPMFMLKA